MSLDWSARPVKPTAPASPRRSRGTTSASRPASRWGPRSATVTSTRAPVFAITSEGRALTALAFELGEANPVLLGGDIIDVGDATGTVEKAAGRAARMRATSSAGMGSPVS